jgi:cell division protein FtsN
MTKDFKNKRVSTDTPINDAVSWVLAGIALGLFIGLMFYLFSDNGLQTASENSVDNINASTSPSDTAKIEKNDTATTTPDKIKSLNDQRSAYLDKVIEDKVAMERDDRPRFNYHVILPILDVEVPVARPPEWNKPKKKKPKKSEPVEKKKTEQSAKNQSTQYILQVSSHQDQNKALSALKKMKSLGFNAYIKTAKLKGGTWHRVNIGPLIGAEKAAQTEALLISKGINPPLRRTFK